MSIVTSPLRRRTLVIMGVTGSGKTTVGAGVAVKLGLDFVDGDDLHPAENVAKMSRGEALTDEDRVPWLDRIGAVLADQDAHPAGIVVACSALRRSYRDRIRLRTEDPGLHFLFLDVAEDLVLARLRARSHHFMPVSLVGSQFATLERPARDESDVITIEARAGFADTVHAASEAVRQHVPMPFR